MSNNNFQLAPIGVSTYTRIDHLKQTIEALARNTLAQESELYVFSDAARPGDEQKVREVRRYLKGVKGFRSVHIVERVENNRVKNNRGGMKQLLDRSGKLIWLEEDIVTAPGFLRFMNDAIDFYENDPRVLSICGYAPPLGVSTKKDFFALGRFCAWGFGITKDNFDRIKEIPENHLSFIDIRRLAMYGDDIYDMVSKEARGQLSALDVRAMYLQYLEEIVTIYPRHSLVQNIGHDGTGVHCGDTDRFNHEKLWRKRSDFKFERNPRIDRKIVKANAEFRSRKSTFVSRLKHLMIRRWVAIKGRL